VRRKNEQKNKAETHLTSGYTIQSVSRACDVLQCFASEKETLSLAEIELRTSLSKPTAFRIVTTLVERGMLERRDKNVYTLVSQRRHQRRYRFGYASQSEEFSFSRLVSESISRNAYESGIDLLVLNNRYSPRTAVRNAETFVREGVDLVIEFQTSQHSAATVASRLIEAGIPIIAIDIPHPGALYYGANNYRAGLIGGRSIAQACLNQWGGKVDEVLLLELPIAGQLPRSRLTGILAGIRELLPKFPDQQVRFLNGNGQYEHSLEVTRKYLRNNKAQHVLIGGMNDPSCLGALRAFEEGGRGDHCLVVGQNASIEARREMRTPGSRLSGSVGYFPEDYGEAVISLALDTICGKNTPPALFVKHQMITPKNVDQLYPNDALISMGEADSLLFSSR